MTEISSLLLIESDAIDAQAVRDMLVGEPIDIQWAECLSDGIERLTKGAFGAVLLNLCLPDSKGIETFNTIYAITRAIPILIIGNSDIEGVAIQALQHGAQDYLLRPHLDRHLLTRSLHNMVERKVAKEALFQEKERAQVMLNCIGDAVLSTDVSGNINYLNVVAERMTGWPWKEASGRPLAEVFRIIDGTTREPARSPLDLAIQQDKVVGLAANCILIRRDGYESRIEDSSAPIHDGQGQITGAVMVFHDVSVARAMAIQMSHLAQHDCLTDLPNRILLKDRLTQSIASSRHRRNQIALLYLDLDRFKNINDALGYAVGDQLLQSVAARVGTCLRSTDTLSRVGGDEFVVTLAEMEREAESGAIARRIMAAAVAPYRIAGHELHVSVSIGISNYPNDGLDVDALLTAAETAMYKAKEDGRNNYRFFTAEMNAGAVENQSLEDDLRRALDRHELVLHYQPKINLETRAITGAEALVRWMHPDRGLVPPLQFIPVAEDSGLIVPIGQWVLREACAQAQKWIDAGLPSMSMAVNVSSVEFRNPEFLTFLRMILHETGLDPHLLEIEITESVLMQDSEASTSVLQALKAIGVQLALDDFGTGYSSLSYLKRFPIDVLKVDKSFVRDITTNSNGGSIVEAVISMGKSLKQRVIAEGIETPEQLSFLLAHHCDEGQGYYFSPPVVASQFSQLLACNSRAVVAAVD
jgi:diguanylate cyclase (GGDEF)-like protein/PAS domain S-box-containing protein